jgi:hypothetical protein
MNTEQFDGHTPALVISEYEPTSNCGYEECNAGYACEDTVCTHAYVDFHEGQMVFHLKCKNGFEWTETWAYERSDFR